MQDEQAGLRADKKKQNKFVRFILKSWQPVPTWQSTIILFLIIGIALVVFGIVLIAINASIVEYSQQYDNCEDATCVITFTLTEKMEQPVFLYYEIDNFYQNHRRYIKSKSTDQLAGKLITSDTATTDCDPAITNAQMGKTVSFDGTTTLNASDVAIPCGLIAKSLFTDTYQLYSGNAVNAANNITINSNGIAWPSDVENKFKNTDTPQAQWQNMTDEHFIVWMRTAGLPNFRKLWGRIETDLAAGEYTISIDNSYSVSDFGGEKHFVLSTTGPFGGKNYFLAISYLAVGGVCLLITIFFGIRWRQYAKKNT